MTTPLRLRCVLFGSLALLASFSGCGGGSVGALTPLTDSGGERTVEFGSLTTRIAGTAQPPVASGGSGTVITGIAGGVVSSLVLSDPTAAFMEMNLLFSSNRATGGGQIYQMNINGGEVHRLLSTQWSDSGADWSPDRTQFVFERNLGGRTALFKATDSGRRPLIESDVVQLTNSSASDFSADWSPNGDRIVFVTARDGRYHIYVMNTDGSNQTRLTTGDSFNAAPCWSPDGSKIVFHSTRSGAATSDNYEIWTMNADGTGLTRLTNNAVLDQSPVWSPDGSKIAFVSYRDGGVPHIFVMKADGSQATRLTTVSALYSEISWSPNGTQLAYQTQQDGNYEIYEMNADGAYPVNLTKNIAFDNSPSFSPPLTKRVLVGSGGTLGTVAAGFLFGQWGDTFTSVVAFDTPSAGRSLARVTTPTGIAAGLSNYLFTITASDSLTRLAFMNGKEAPVTVVIGSGGEVASAAGAFVSFNAGTGRVATILPYASTKAASSVRQVGNRLVMQGRFLGVWDEKGKNLAPQGATEAQLDAKTGQPLSIQ